MSEKNMISLCGDDCSVCPRYRTHTTQELADAAELWYRVGWRDRILTSEEISCAGCSTDKSCTYGLVECTKVHGVDKCSQCTLFPCEKISEMLARTEEYQKRCGKLCTEEELAVLTKAFFNKESNL